MRYSIVPAGQPETLLTASVSAILAGADSESAVRCVVRLQGELTEPGLSILTRSIRATIGGLEAGQGFDFESDHNERLRLFRHTTDCT